MDSLPKDLFRTAGFTLTREAGSGQTDGLTLNGYAAVFGVPTRINSWEGTFDESIRKGAFRKTLRETTPVMQFDHGRHPMIGSIPIGTYSSLSEDVTGLKVEGRLSDNWLIQPVRDAIAAEAIKGMSFRFSVVRDAWTDSAGDPIDPVDPSFWDALYMGDQHDRGPLQRELIEVKMPEAGPVVWPAYSETSVSVRAAEVARSVLDDELLVHEVRSALALGPREVATDLPVDPDLRRDIARAILFGAGPAKRTTQPAPMGRLRDLIQQTAPADPGHPDPQEHAAARQAAGEQERTTDAPSPDGHPSPAPQNDAPSAEGHPSMTPQQTRAKFLRQAYLTRERVGKA